jgi:hypothetical protein
LQPRALILVAVLALFLATTTACGPLAVWTSDGYTVDETHSEHAASVLGKCFRLLVDADVLSYSDRIALLHGEVVEVAGRVYVVSASAPPSRGEARLPKGSRIAVERVLRWKNVEESDRTPYIRFDGALVDASSLFRDTGDDEGPPHRLANIGRLLEPCADGPSTK